MKVLYTVEGKRLNDSWYIKENGVYHAYFLEYPVDGDKKGMYDEQTVGHSVSDDLRKWTYKGTVLKRKENFWLDKGIATGSVVKFGDKYLMLVTGNSYGKVSGFALAQSDDLYNWEFVGDAPVIDRTHPYTFDYVDKKLEGWLLADPYIYPEKVDGYYYIFINGRLNNAPSEVSGSVLVMRTADFNEFTPYKVAALDCCDRMETPFVWKDENGFHLYAGTARYKYDENGKRLYQYCHNAFYKSDYFSGPYRHTNNILYPEAKPSSIYIAKVIEDTDGENVAILNMIPEGGVGPFHVSYGKNEEVILTLKE